MEDVNCMEHLEDSSSLSDDDSFVCSQIVSSKKSSGSNPKRTITVVYDPPLSLGHNTKVRKTADLSDLTVPQPSTSTETGTVNGAKSSNPSVPSDWNLNQVKDWIGKRFDATIASKFEEQEVDGKTLLSDKILSDTSLALLGLNTLGKKTKFETAVLELKGSEQATGPLEVSIQAIKPLSKETDRLLTNMEKKAMTCDEKRIYNTKKKMITAEIIKEWPVYKPIPTFRANYTDEILQLQQFQARLSKDERYTYGKWFLGQSAIKEMVLKHMAERRRKEKYASVFNNSGYTTTESETSSSDSPPSSSSSSSTQLENKRMQWKDYFHQDMTQNSCETILLVVLKKDSVKDLQMLKHLHPLKKKLNLPLLRGKDKNMFIRAIANSLLQENYVTIVDNANMANLTREDIKCIKELSL